uniref:Complement C1q-like protein 4 n=1 Tax=Crassostrea virginica TaxID=6565 RepID=A0A8B8AUM2_CRAVI|nr:complement C1q-like protein 4 [Crassostrea virginica]
MWNILVHLIAGYVSNNNVSTRIGFTVSATSPSNTWNSGTLVFPKVITNVGNGYNPSDGVFTAPMAGGIRLLVNIQSYDTLAIYVDMVFIGTPKVRTMAETSLNDHDDAGPNLAVLSLKTGDRVWIKHNARAGYYTFSDGPVTTFSAFPI